MSLREQKKQATRQAISDAATRLFIQRGFDAVTIAEVAETAGVARMTVTNYFPRKEDLVLDAHEAFTQGPARALTTRVPGVPALAALREDCLEAVTGKAAVAGFADVGFIRLVRDSPTLAARLRELHEHREQALTDTLLAEADHEDPLVVRTVAAHLAAVYRLLFTECWDRLRDGADPDEVRAHLARMTEVLFDLLEPAYGGFAVKD
ncbi:AcrR family transcriptional regulator [Crossiella equi]|uniref:AcrR family transcriptional regulator n=1 Tax=Crossiella equi TaxID=130796 RepID=A0ABS5A8N5_9PSEU|nr:TetR/AcrR family transcriptional regulator [Crossiella equi]MBP2472958.1 AcrR family transcriptional regulator [Crossiella equi]